MDDNNSSNNEIELNPPTGDEMGVEGDLLIHESSMNLAFCPRQGPSEDGSINPASVHALQTACTSLQHKLNDKSKKYNELYQKNKIMQKALFDLNKQEHISQPGGMDEYCPQDPSITHAAGAGACSVEDEQMIENRARQGYVSHLEREVLRNTSALARGNKEIQRLKRILGECNREKKELLQRVEQLQTELDVVSRRYEEIVKAGQRNIDDLEKQHQFEENIALKEKIETVEKNDSKDDEVKDLRSKLVVAEKEMSKLSIQYRELDRRTHEKEDGLQRLQAQCIQYEIEADINRRYRQGDEADVNAALIRALDMIKSQRMEVRSLLTQVQQHKTIIEELYSANERVSKPAGKVHSTAREELGNAPRRSMNQNRDETTIGTHSNEVFTGPDQEQVPITTSPRLKELFVPTWNTHIPEMLANEDIQVSRRPSGPHLSPRSHSQSPQLLCMNIGATSSPDNQRCDAGSNMKVESQNSPRSRTEHHRKVEPALVQPNPQVHLLPSGNGGARPKRSCSQDYYLPNRFMENSSVAHNRIPDRMTQSAILLRDDSNHDNSAMSRSLFSPNSSLETVNHTSPERNNFARTKQDPLRIQPVYGNNYRLAENGPDYENIVNIKPHSSARRQVEEHDDTVLVKNVNDISMAGGRTVENKDASEAASNNSQLDVTAVSALKICPVCDLEYSCLTMDQFQIHVFECFDNCEEPTTLQSEAAASENDRNCPMCGEVFSLTIPQETYEQHVLAHFGEEPLIERSESINS